MEINNKTTSQLHIAANKPKKTIKIGKIKIFIITNKQKHKISMLCKKT